MTPDQQAHEDRIQQAHESLCAATNRTDRQGYWQTMVGGILGRDPAVTERLEAERKARVGL